MQIVLQIKAETYQKHYEEQGENEPQTLRRRLFDDALEALSGVDFAPLADAIINKDDRTVILSLADSYANVPETYAGLEDQEDAL